MILMRVGLPVVLFPFRKAVLPSNALRVGQNFPAFPAVRFGGAERR